MVERVEVSQPEAASEFLATTSDPRQAAWAFWQDTIDQAVRFGPLVFELMAHAMQGQEYAEPLRTALIECWIESLTAFWVAGGLDTATAQRRARLDLAVARGLLQDLLLTGDRRGVDEAMADYVQHALVAERIIEKPRRESASTPPNPDETP